MRSLNLEMTDTSLDFERAWRRAETLAVEGNTDAMLISWADREKGLHSPHCLKCEIYGRPGWEVYGENHGGRLRISVNGDRYVFIYS